MYTLTGWLCGGGHVSMWALSSSHTPSVDQTSYCPNLSKYPPLISVPVRSIAVATSNGVNPFWGRKERGQGEYVGREGQQRRGEKEGEGGDERDHWTVQSSTIKVDKSLFMSHKTVHFTEDRASTLSVRWALAPAFRRDLVVVTSPLSAEKKRADHPVPYHNSRGNETNM